MPQVVIHTSKIIDPEKKAKLLKEIRDAIPEVLEIDEKIGQVLLYESDSGSRGIHESRSINFAFIQISMYPGRKHEMKERLTDRFIQIVSKYTGTGPEDIICTINEISPDNYFGGTSHKYIEDITRNYPGLNQTKE